LYSHLSIFKVATMALVIPAVINPVMVPGPLLLKEARTLLTHPYLPFEAGYALNSDGMYHVAGTNHTPTISASSRVIPNSPR
jgi:hypothetical protein